MADDMNSMTRQFTLAAMEDEELSHQYERAQHLLAYLYDQVGEVESDTRLIEAELKRRGLA